MIPISKIETLKEIAELAYTKARHHRKTNQPEAAAALDAFGNILSKRVTEAAKENYYEGREVA